MAKYRYTMRVKKVVYMTEETFIVIAENEAEAKKLATEEAKKRPEKFEKETTRYNAEVYSYSCNPVEE